MSPLPVRMTPKKEVVLNSVAEFLGNWALHTSYLSRAPHIYSCKFFLARVNFFFFRFNAKIWQFTVYFAVMTLKIGNFVVIYAFFGVNFILQKFCLCKKMTNMRYDWNVLLQIPRLRLSFYLLSNIPDRFFNWVPYVISVQIFHVRFERTNCTALNQN